MANIKLNQNLEQLNIVNSQIHIVHTRNHETQKLGLLNHRTLPHDEGLLFFKKSWFHTFGMRFPVCVLAFDKTKNLIVKPTVVNPNHVFFCPQKSHYIVEINADHYSIENEFLAKNKIHVFNQKKSKMIFLFFKFFPIFIIILSFCITMCNAFGLNTINLNLGKTRTINLDQTPQSIQIEDPDIIELERIGISNSIKITPKQSGNTSLTFQYIDGNDETIHVNVLTQKNEINHTIQQSQYLENMSPQTVEHGSRQLKKIGAHYSVNAGKIFILGTINDIEKFREISKIIAPQPNLFFPSFDIEPSMENKVIDSINTDIRIMGHQNLKIIRIGEKRLLKGVYSSETSREKIWSYVSAVLPNVIDATSSFLGESKLVQINIEFFEVGKSQKKDIGFQYPNFETGGFGVTFNADKPSFQIAPFSVFFRALEGRNYVREIAKPVIITRSGEKATFLAGGEVPIQTVTSSNSSVNASVSFKSVGIIFDVTPRVNDDGTIWIKLNIEYSQINEKLSYQNSPGFNSRKVNTNIILNENTAAIISGLIQNLELKKTEGIPLLKSIPILGEFFKSKNYQNHSTELWIAISAIQKDIENVSIKPSNTLLKGNGLLSESHESIL